MARPGIMLYFDLVDPLKLLSYEDKGMLLDAMLEYGQFEVVPEFEGKMEMAWSFIRPKLDRDKVAYKDKVQHNTYNSYCAKCKRDNVTPLDYETWLAKHNQSISIDSSRSPKTTSKADTESKTNRSGKTNGIRECMGYENASVKNPDMIFNDKRYDAINLLKNYDL